ncbi:ROK family protein [Humidesulfovibrio idahonensis]
MKRLYGAIEAGGTKFFCAVYSSIDEQQEPKHSTRIDTKNPETTFPEVLQWFRKIENQFNCKIVSFGIVSFGPICVDRSSKQYGTILNSPKSAWTNFNYITNIHEQFPSASVNIDTDVNGSALGESNFGAGKGLSNVVYITIGTGIGVGIVINGKPVHGLLHPEGGHIRIPHIDGDEPGGNCPYHGACWEGLCSGPAIEKRESKPSSDIVASRSWERIANYTASAIVNIIYTISPNIIIIGGGVSHCGSLGSEYFLELIRNFAIAKLNNYPSNGIYSASMMQSYIVKPSLGDNSGIIGASILSKIATSGFNELDYLSNEQARSRIEKEDDLINHRMSWCVGVNAVLVNTYILSFVADEHVQEKASHYREILPYVGISFTLCFWLSILAAYFAIWQWDSMAPSRNGTYSKLCIAFAGSIASVISPLVFLSFWICTLLKRNDFRDSLLICLISLIPVMITWYIVMSNKDNKR